MIERGRYTSGRIAVVNPSASMASLERRRVEGGGFEDLPRAREAGAQGALLGLCSLIPVAVGSHWLLSSLPVGVLS